MLSRYFKLKVLLLSLIALTTASLSAQKPTIFFTGEDDNGQFLQIRYATVTNLTRGWTEFLFWPDTVLTFKFNPAGGGIGISDFTTNGNLHLFQNTPNPFNGTTILLLNVQEGTPVKMTITDFTGRSVASLRFIPQQAGTHQFIVNISHSGYYTLITQQNEQVSSIKMICNTNGNAKNSIEYIGIVKSEPIVSTPKSDEKGESYKSYNIGDEMQYCGFAIRNNSVIQSHNHTGTLAAGEETVILQFPTNNIYSSFGQPCPNAPTVTDYDGNIYPTAQYGTQCWMKENLRTTHFADGSAVSSFSTSSFPPYYYFPGNDTNNVATYGLLYNWKTVMHGAASSNANPSGVQGICPDGWHVPSNAEWTQFTDYLKDQNVFSCNFNVSIGKALCDTDGWLECSSECTIGNNSSTNNATGFSILPAGHFYWGAAQFYGMHANFWTSTEYDVYDSYCRILEYNYAGIDTDLKRWVTGYSVRCVRN